MVFEMNLNNEPFSLIKSGEKTVEFRLYDEKRRQIAVGDYIRFTAQNGDVLVCMIKRLHVYPSFKELYKCIPLEKCGYTKENISFASHKDMEKYYPLEKQKLYSVVGIEIELINSAN